MKRVIVALLRLCGAAASVAAEPQTRALRLQLKIQEEILKAEKVDLAEHQASLQESWVRVRSESTDYLRAQRQGEELDGLNLRDDDLRHAEAELMMHLFEGQRLRRALAASQLMIGKTLEEIRRLEGEVGSEVDPLT